MGLSGISAVTRDSKKNINDLFIALCLRDARSAADRGSPEGVVELRRAFSTLRRSGAPLPNDEARAVAAIYREKAQLEPARAQAEILRGYSQQCLALIPDTAPTQDSFLRRLTKQVPSLPGLPTFLGNPAPSQPPSPVPASPLQRRGSETSNASVETAPEQQPRRRDSSVSVFSVEATAPRPPAAVEASSIVPDAFRRDAEKFAALPEGAKTTLEELWFSASDPATPVRCALFKNPVYAENIRLTYNALAKRKFDAKSVDDQLDKIRWIPFMRECAPVMVRGASAAMSLESRTRKSNLQENWDVLIVGGGPNGTAAASALSKRQGLSVLLVDAADAALMSANFGATGRFFAKNSRNGAENFDDSADALGTGVGNINPQGGPVQEPAMTGERWPSGEVTAQATQVNLWHTATPTLWSTAVQSVSPNAATGARYAVGLFDRNSRESIEVNANVIVFATGLGRPANPIQQGVAGHDLIDAAFKDFNELASLSPRDARAQLKKKQPDIFSVDQLFTLASLQADGLEMARQSPKSYRDDIETVRIASIAPGDSGRTALEYLAGQAPKIAYDNPNSIATAQEGAISRIVAFTTESGPNSCETFIQKSRARYARLAAVAKKAFGRKPKLDYRNARVDKIRPDGNGAYLLDYVYADESRGMLRAEKIMVGTGQESTLSELLDPSLLQSPEDGGPLERSSNVAQVRGDVGDKNLKVAKRVLGPGEAEAIYLAGPAAGIREGDLVDGDPANIQENRAGLAVLIPRTLAFASQLEVEAEFAIEQKTAPSALGLEASQFTTETLLSGAPDDFNPSHDTITAIHSEMNRLLLQQQVKNSSEGGEVSFQFERRSDGKLAMRLKGLSANSAKTFAAAIKRHSALLDLLQQQVRGAARPTFRYSVKEGAIDIANPEVVPY